MSKVKTPRQVLRDAIEQMWHNVEGDVAPVDDYESAAKFLTECSAHYGRMTWHRVWLIARATRVSRDITWNESVKQTVYNLLVHPQQPAEE